MTTETVLALPFTGRWLARNSPARKVPSHGSHLLGTTYSIDFLGVDDRGRSAPWGWCSAFAVEKPTVFAGFGRPILAPADGEVIVAHDGEEDHVARRSQLTLATYYFSQPSRYRRGGPTAIAGNHVIIALGENGPFVTLVHLRRGGAGAPGAAGVSGGAGGRVRQLRKQHPTARARPGHRLDRLGDLPRAAHGLSAS
nr:M23 family peptidase [Corynebacterium halotolerans]